MTQDEIIEMAREAGLYQDINVSFHQALRNFYNLAIAKEREACAQVVDARLEKWLSLFGKDKMYKWMFGLRKAIRARGEA